MKISLVLACLANALSWSANASSLTTLHQFAGGTDGAYPVSELLSQSGLLYGSTTGEKKGAASIFSVDPKTGAETQLFAFSGKVHPVDALGYIKPFIYGESTGEIFRVNHISGQERKVGKVYVTGGLAAANGLLYGTQDDGGTADYGTIFAFDPATKAVTVLYSFQGQQKGDGQYPNAGVTISNSVLYGTAGGGATNGGIVFSFDLQTQTYTLIKSFDGDGGAGPTAAPILANGLLYGTTDGGIEGAPAFLYSLDPVTGTEQVLHTFTKTTDAYLPNGELRYRSGKLYGTSRLGGAKDYGAIYEVDAKSGKEQVIYSFQKLDGNGQQPIGGLTYEDGALYGTTSMGDSKHYFGTVFQFIP